MRLIYFSFSVLCLLIITTSCNYFKRSSDKKVIYTVTKDKINVKQKRDPSSSVIGTVYKGDTIVPRKIPHHLYISFNYKGTWGWIKVSDLKSHSIHDMAKVSNMQLGVSSTIVRDYLSNYVNWRTGRFWLIFLVLIVASIILIKLGEKLEDYMYDNYDIDDDKYYKLQFVIDMIGALFSGVAIILFKILGKKLEEMYDNIDFHYNKLPFFSMIIGALYSIVYMFFREDVLQAMFVTKFYWISFEDNWIHWYLWLISLIGVMGLLYFWIKEFIHYGYRGIITVLYFTFLAIITFNVGLLGGIISILCAGVWIIYSITKDIKFGYVSSKSSNKITTEDRLTHFYQQQEIDRKFKEDLDN
ncbi:MAG: hypothetical protein H8E34_06475 [Bacteroidetes bacterium]|nr:hypothetical protein [Bacteroidota bacterium]